jgi:hypothetical protein
MELKKITVDGREVEFANAWRGTRSGFAHDTTMFIDGRRVAEHTCHYLNRTWERYTYQTVMRCALDELIEREREYLKAQFLRANGYQKLTAKRKEAFEEECKQNADLAFYAKIYAELA